MPENWRVQVPWPPLMKIREENRDGIFFKRENINGKILLVGEGEGEGEGDDLEVWR